MLNLRCFALANAVFFAFVCSFIAATPLYSSVVAGTIDTPLFPFDLGSTAVSYAGWTYPRFPEIIAGDDGTRNFFGDASFNLSKFKPYSSTKVALSLVDSGGSNGSAATEIRDGRDLFTAVVEDGPWSTRANPTRLDITAAAIGASGRTLDLTFQGLIPATDGLAHVDAFGIGGASKLVVSDTASDIIKNSQIVVNPTDVTMKVTFSPTTSLGTPVTLNALAEAAGYDHFNWLSYVTYSPFPLHDRSGNLLSTPFFDPPLGGWYYTVADYKATFWNEGENYPHDWYHLSSHTHSDSIDFEDTPSHDGFQPDNPDHHFVFYTSLVGVAPKDGHSDFDVFLDHTVNWWSNYNEATGTGGVDYRLFNPFDPNSDGGTGGIQGWKLVDRSEMPADLLARIVADGGSFYSYSGTNTVPEPTSVTV